MFAMLKKVEARPKEEKRKKEKGKGTKAAFARIDRVWSTDTHRYVLRKSNEPTKVGEYEEHAFNVRRKFDWENKYTGTVVDIRSKPLQAALKHVMGHVKGISLEQDPPSVDPNMMFLFLEELRTYMKKLRAQGSAEKAKNIALEARHLKVLVKYLDHDYEETRNTLYPMLESKKITFDLLWALFRSNEIIYTPTYSTEDEPRAFKLDYAFQVRTNTPQSYFDALATKFKQKSSLLKGDYYTVEGGYLEYDGTIFGIGDIELTIDRFEGHRNISDLPCYPLRYHPDHAKLKEELIERGKSFVAMEGRKMYVQQGIAFYKVFQPHCLRTKNLLTRAS